MNDNERDFYNFSSILFITNLLYNRKERFLVWCNNCFNNCILYDVVTTEDY